MSNRPIGEAGLVPADRPVETEYERDFYSWAFEQARLVREGRWEGVDRENVAEEIEFLGAGAICQVAQCDSCASATHAEVGSPARTSRSELGAFDQGRTASTWRTCSKEIPA